MSKYQFKRFIWLKALSITLILAVVLVFTGSAYSGSESTVLERVDTNEKIMALTFDAGSDAGNAMKILNILSRYNVKSTFFLTGEFAEYNPDLAYEILDRGHEIGNHSYTHPYFTELTARQMRREIRRTQNEIYNATGQYPVPLFRPPYGEYNSTTLRVLGNQGYPWTVMWTIDTIDWDGTPANTMINKVLKNAKPGAIVLMHVGGGAAYTTDALPSIIKGLRSKGYKLMTVTKMLEKAYPSSDYTYYTVQPGDTLWGIAQSHGVTVQEIVDANNIENPDLIYPGQVLKIPVS